MKRFPLLFFLLFITASGLLLISSCDTPEKVLKSPDIQYKKAKAISWYNKKEYFKCIPVFEELIGMMKGRESTEDLYYMYAKANYYQGDYMIAAYHFKRFYDEYPTSDKAEECLFMQGESFQHLSPKPDLDQTYTQKALEAYQFFLNTYSGTSKYSSEANNAIAVLRKKLEKKAMSAADLYYRTSNYKASATSYVNILKEFPDIEESEKVTFMIVKSSFKYAQNSIPSKKAERFNLVIKNYNDFKYKFGKSKYLVEAKKYEQESHYLAVESAFDWAETAYLGERERLFNAFFAEAELQKPYISDKAQLQDIAKWTEKGQFLIVKGYYMISEERKNSEKLPDLEQTIRTYYIFVDKYPQSRYYKEAERIFNNSTDELKKLKSNG